MRIALLALVLSAAARAEGFKGSIGVGVGNAYDLVGARLELGWGRFSGLVGAPAAIRSDWDHSLSVGGRWSFLRPESGPALALVASWSWYGPQGDFDARETVVIISATLSWRFRLGPIFLELGAGPAISHDSYRFPSRDYGADSGRLIQRWRYGVTPLGASEIDFPFDADAGLSFAW